MSVERETRDKIAIMQAWLSGQAVQCCRVGGGEWRDIEGPGWDWVGFKYRIKPADPREWVMVMCPTHGPYVFEPDKLPACRPHDSEVVRVREVQ